MSEREYRKALKVVEESLRRHEARIADLVEQVREAEAQHETLLQSYNELLRALHDEAPDD